MSLPETILEGIIFGEEFNSMEYGLHLIERDAATPDEKEVTMSIPYLQGEHDFSMLLGERVFHSRAIKYTFGMFNRNYVSRKRAENDIKRILLSSGYNKLIDTHDPDGFWWGKCSAISVDDDAQYNQIFITIEFTCYPYLLAHLNYFDDDWDTFSFDYDVSCFSAYRVDGSFEIPYINNGSTTVKPTFYSDKPMQVKIGSDDPIKLPGGFYTDFYTKISRGTHTLKITGTGLFMILGRKEFMN